VTVSGTEKSLSQKPLGYLLAILGGTLGAPIGWIMSPVVLLILNNVMPEKDGKHPNRFLAWALVGIIGAPLSLAPIMIGAGSDKTASRSNQNEQVSQNSPSDNINANEQVASNSTGVNMQNYLKLQNGMTYEQVVGILGEEGEEMSSNEIGGTRTVMYMWKAKGFGGSNMNAMFQDNALITKAQFGLD